jgi:tight adherence protein B
VTVGLVVAVLSAAAVVLLVAAVPRTAHPAPAPHSDATAERPRRAGRSRAALVAASAGLGATTGWVLAGPVGVVAGLAAGLVPPLLERRRRTRRASLVDEQLIDAVAAVASALRSGRSLVQSIAIAGTELGGPIGELLEETARDASLGLPVGEALDRLADRVGTADARLVVGVLRLHRRTGGALGASLDDLSRTLRSRRDAARELRSLTAQARLSAAILGLLPLGFFLFLSVVARRDVESAYRTTAGASAIGVGLALQGAAFVWIRRLLRVEDA